MIDHMVIKLGKYLRILGYDAEWDLSVRTHELIKRANNEDRLFLTRNTHLPDQYPAVNHTLIIKATNPAQQLTEVVRELSLDTESRLFSRCIRCNVDLAEVRDKDEIRASVHENVFSQYDNFFTCPGCHTVFWKGSHVRNTCRKLAVRNAAEGPAAF